MLYIIGIVAMPEYYGVSIRELLASGTRVVARLTQDMNDADAAASEPDFAFDRQF